MKGKLKSLLTLYWPILLFFLLTFYFMRNFLLKDGHILYAEFFGSTNYFFFLKEFLKPWGSYATLGHSNIGYPTTFGNPAFYIYPPALSFPWLAIYSLLQFLFGSFVFRIEILTALILPFIGMYFFARFWFREFAKSSILLNSLSFVAGTTYAINAIMGARIFAGHLFYNYAYGLFPFFLLFIFRSVEVGNVRGRILPVLASGIVFSAFLWFMPHMITISLIPLGFYFLLFILGNIKKTKAFVIIYILSVVIGFLLIIHAWLPAFFYKEAYPFIGDPTYVRPTWFNFSDILPLIGDEKSLIKNSQEYNNLYLLKLLLPILGGIALILNNKKKSLFAFFLIVFGIILGMGINFPFEKIYLFLFKNIFLLKPIKDTSKFIILYVFALSLLVPVLFIYVQKVSRYMLFPVLLLYTFYLLLVNPLYSSGNFGGDIVPFDLPKKYNDLNFFLEKQEGDFRVAVYPSNSGIGNYTWFPKLPNGPIDPTLFNRFLPLSKNLGVSNNVVSDYSSRYLSFLEANLDRKFAVERLGEERNRYLIIDPDMKGYEKQFEMLRNNPVVSEVKLVEGFHIFEVKNFVQEVTKKRNTVYYYGDTKGIRYLPSDLVLINLVQNPIDILSKNYSNTVLLYGSSLNDLFLSSLLDFKFSFLSKTRLENPAEGFAVGGDNFREYVSEGINFYDPEGFFTGSVNKIEKKSSLKRGIYKAFLHILNYPNQSNGVKVTIGDISFEKKGIQQDPKKSLEWIDFGEVSVEKDDPFVAIDNLDPKLQIISSLLIVPKKEYDKRYDRFLTLIGSKTVIPFENEIVNTKLSGRSKVIYALSQSYSPYWEVCGRENFYVNFYALGTTCKEAKKPSPFFKPTPVYIGSFIFSLLINMFIFGTVIKLSLKQMHDKTHS